MQEKIKMPISFHGNFVVSINDEGEEQKSRCQKLFIRKMTDEQKKKYHGGLDEKDIPTHQVAYHDFGCRYLIDGKLVANEEDHVSFDVKGKVYTFSSAVPRR